MEKKLILQPSEALILEEPSRAEARRKIAPKKTPPNSISDGPRNRSKVWYPYILGLAGVHYRNMSTPVVVVSGATLTDVC